MKPIVPAKAPRAPTYSPAPPWTNGQNVTRVGDGVLFVYSAPLNALTIISNSSGIAKDANAFIIKNLPAPTNPPDAANKSYVDSPFDGNSYVRQGATWIILPSGFLTDAPSDSHYYQRLNGAWSPDPVQSDAPNDGNTYSRKNAAWVSIPIYIDAPSDGTMYARENAAWAQVISFPEAPLDGQVYGRSGGNWVVDHLVTDAPLDGQKYVRQNGAWVIA